MRKPFLWTAVLVLATAWALAQGTASQQPDQSQAATGKSIEGCLSSGADKLILKDAKGKTYELTGDTSELKENIGHKVRLYGEAGSSGGGATSTRGTQSTFGVKKVVSLSDTCK